MTKFLVLVLFAVAATGLLGVVHETASLQEFMYGQTDATSYDNWLSHVAEGIADQDYNLYAPYDVQNNNFGDFHVPVGADLDNWNTVVSTFLAGNLAAAEIYASNYGFPYQIVEFTDTDTERVYYILREIPDMDQVDDNGTPGNDYDDEVGAFAWGWGIYIYNPDASLPIIVNCPHPTDDFATVPVGIKAFQMWDARYFIASGCGREVRWTNVNPYYNSKSISDPTRSSNHPFVRFYNKACDEIRDEFGVRELSAQLHSYDWNRHENYPSCQLSAGNGNNHVDLPIRDNSALGLDIIRATPAIVHQRNAIGVHPPVRSNLDYYGVNYNDGDFYYINEDDSLEQVSNHIDLPGYSNSNQQSYTMSGWSDYDGFDPFFHIEMDELPNCYPQTENNYWWFYGWNPESGTWQMDHLFDKTFAFYMPWVEAMAAVLPQLWQDDVNNPTTPTELTPIGSDYNSVTLSWVRSSDYDFDSYQVLFSQEPISNDNYSIYTRSQINTLAAQNIQQATVGGLDPNTNYYFALRAVDKLGNTGEISNEVTAFTGAAELANMMATGEDGYVQVSWRAQYQSNNQGFFIERADDPDGPWNRVVTWEDDPSLTGSTATDVSYYWNDEDVTNGQHYYYRVGAVDNADVEMIHQDVLPAQPMQYWQLQVAQVSGPLATASVFGANDYAYSGWGDQFDDSISNPGSGSEYLEAEFYEQYWNNVPKSLSRHIVAGFDPMESYESWVYRVRTNQTGQEYSISIQNLPQTRNAQRFYLVDGGTYHDLSQGAYTFTLSNTSWKTFTIYWGNLIPSVTVDGRSNRIFQPGDTQSISWSIYYNYHRSIVDHWEVYVKNDETTFTVADDLDWNITSTTWTVPDVFGDIYPDMHVEVNGIMAQGDTITAVGDYRWAVVSPACHIQAPQGWNMASTPLTSTSTPAADIYGVNRDFYEWVIMGYSQDTTMDWGKGYWMYVDQDVDYTESDAFLQKTEVVLDLYTGWNLMPNPFMIELKRNQLRFDLAGQTLDYSDAVTQDYIAPAIFSYSQQHGYYTADIVQPQSSFWVYCKQSGMSLRYTPYYKSGQEPKFEKDIDFSLVCQLDTGDVDQVNAGTSAYATDDNDRYYELAKPANKPWNNALTMGILPSWFPAPDSLYHASYAAAFDEVQDPEITESYSWQVRLRSPANQQVNLWFNGELPQDYYLFIELPGIENQIPISELDNYIYTPQNNVTEFTMELRYVITGAEDNVSAASFTCSNSPNPFNPETVISFNLPQNGKVKLNVYNLKGQKVKTLVNSDLQSGKHDIVFKGRDDHSRALASGVYLYRLEAKGQKTITKKMMLLK